jgi:hypothetical protein
MFSVFVWQRFSGVKSSCSAGLFLAPLKPQYTIPRLVNKKQMRRPVSLRSASPRLGLRETQAMLQQPRSPMTGSSQSLFASWRSCPWPQIKAAARDSRHRSSKG